jgi:homoaconitate hydratase
VLAGQTLIEKIAQGHMVENEQHIVRSMDIIKIQPKHVMTHDNTAAVMNKYAHATLFCRLSPQL